MNGDYTSTGDQATPENGNRYFDQSADHWLVGQAVSLLHASDEVGALAYQRAVQLLREQGNAVDTITDALAHVSPDDYPLRWALLYILKDVGDMSAVGVLKEVASARLPDEEQRGCESKLDAEILVRTMAIETLGRFAAMDAGRDAAHSALNDVVRAQKHPALRVEAIKAMGEKSGVAADLLEPDEEWMLSVKTVRVDDVTVDIGPVNGHERKSPVPKLADSRTAPTIRREGGL